MGGGASFINQDTERVRTDDRKGESMSSIIRKLFALFSAHKLRGWAIAGAFVGASLTSSLAHAQLAYVVQGDTLYSVDSSTSRTALSTGWSGATSIAHDAFIHIVQNSRLFRVTTQGVRTQLGNPEWGGATEMAWNNVTNKLYIVQNDHLQRIDDANNSNTGSYSVLGGAIWNGTTSMTSIGDSLYIIRAGNLYKVNPTTGSRSVLGNAGDWTGATRMVAQRFNSQTSPTYLYVIENSRLHRVDPADGSYVVLGNPEWDGTTSMACYDSGAALFASLLVIQNSRLHSVQQDGSYQVLGSAIWTGPTVMAGTLCNNL